MKNICLILALLLCSPFVFGHGDHKHSLVARMQVFKARQTLEEINVDYLAKVKPIFKKACFDCHGDKTNFPWYYSLPIVKQLIDYDIEEGKEHLELSHDFPFKGHGDPVKDLEEIKESIEEGEMPPWKYLIMHSEATLSEADKKIIFKWVEDSLSKIKEKNK